MHEFLICPGCGAEVRRYRNPFPTVDVIVSMGDRIVLIQRAGEPFGWALPGGFVDYGETLEAAAVREIAEETGLKLINLKQFHAYSRADRDPRQHNISIVFTAEGQGELRAGDDAAAVQLFRLDQLPAPLCFDHAEILADYCAAKSAS